jgi:hypothetical protein
MNLRHRHRQEILRENGNVCNLARLQRPAPALIEAELGAALGVEAKRLLPRRRFIRPAGGGLGC